MVGFKKLKFYTGENVGDGNLQLPQQEMHSTASWMSIKAELLGRVEISPEEKVEAVSGIAYLMRHIAAVILMCDARDLGVAVEDNLTKSEISVGSMKKLSALPETNVLNNFEPNIYIYDNYPNGIGFSQVIFEKGEAILEKTLEVIDGCVCECGCPSCVGPPIRPADNHKDAARFIIKLLLDKLYH